jgi:hypothetical protein
VEGGGYRFLLLLLLFFFFFGSQAAGSFVRFHDKQDTCRHVPRCVGQTGLLLHQDFGTPRGVFSILLRLARSVVLDGSFSA